MGKNKWQSLKDVIIMVGDNKAEMESFVEEYNSGDAKYIGEVSAGVQGVVPLCFATHRIKNLYVKEKMSGVQICGEVELYNKALKHKKEVGDYDVVFYPLYKTGTADVWNFGIRFLDVKE